MNTVRTSETRWEQEQEEEAEEEEEEDWKIVFENQDKRNQTLSLLSRTRQVDLT
jgi:hypothetical protein